MHAQELFPGYFARVLVVAEPKEDGLTQFSVARPLGEFDLRDEHGQADARLKRCALQADSSTVEADILGQPVTYKGPDGQSKKDSADLPYDQRCGNIPVPMFTSW